MKENMIKVVNAVSEVVLIVVGDVLSDGVIGYLA